jgi:lysophospholipase L1-like esterase
VRLFQPSLRLTLFAAALALAASPALAASDAHWIGTWGTAPVAVANQHSDFAADTTLRQIVHLSLGGSTLRVVFTNELGTDALTLGGASVALPSALPAPAPASADAATSAIQPATSLPLTFNGHPTLVIPAGAVAVSDPVTLTLPPLSNLAITLFLPGQTLTTLTGHGLALQTNFEAAGNQLPAATLTDAHQTSSWSFLKEVDVEAPKGAAVVAFGDSITDGWRSTSGANSNWPDILADRLLADRSTRNLGVLNMGIGGNRILHDGWGPNALARFDRDVLAPAGVHYLILLEGINDIGHAYDSTQPYDVVTADDLITGLSQLARRAHTHGIKVFGATLTPYLSAKYESPAGEAVREALNQWIRTTPELDGVIDFDQATRDPAHPTVFSPTADSGDHLHPNDAGYKAMGDAINLKLFHN